MIRCDAGEFAAVHVDGLDGFAETSSDAGESETRPKRGDRSGCRWFAEQAVSFFECLRASVPFVHVTKHECRHIAFLIHLLKNLLPLEFPFSATQSKVCSDDAHSAPIDIQVNVDRAAWLARGIIELAMLHVQDREAGQQCVAILSGLANHP